MHARVRNSREWSFGALQQRHRVLRYLEANNIVGLCRDWRQSLTTIGRSRSSIVTALLTPREIVLKECKESPFSVFSHHTRVLLFFPFSFKQLMWPYQSDSSALIYDCPYPLEAINMQPDYPTQQVESKDQHQSASGGHYDALYHMSTGGGSGSSNPLLSEKPWHYSPVFGGNSQPPPPPLPPHGQPYYSGAYPWVPVDSWSAYRPLPPLPPSGQHQHHRPQPQIVYTLRSPAPSPSGSPILSRNRGSSPAGPSTPRRMMPPVPPPKPIGIGGAAAKPPRPVRPRPTLVKAKTIDIPDSSSLEDFLHSDSALNFQFNRQLDSGSKMPSLDSLYEQLKAFASTGPSSGSNNQLATDLAFAALGMVASNNNPLARSRSATFSSYSSSSGRPNTKVYF